MRDAIDGMLVVRAELIDQLDSLQRAMARANVRDSSQRIGAIRAMAAAYGMIAAARGYQRPIGLWNFEEVTVKGSTIKVELNGTVILDGDLSKVSDYMAGHAHPGKDRKSGYFGFAGHNDPVAFRNIAIKTLE